MKIVVANAFIDKNTGEPYNRGEIFESTDEDRIKELRDGGYLAATAEAETLTDNTATSTEITEDQEKSKTAESAKAKSTTDATAESAKKDITTTTK